ncbi:MAG: conjugal transfer protein TrbG [Burkholderiales bacterium]|jgi:type IV secretion system protein VirB9|nr:conjugal transfer protein TrbG [Burkholderiales bacterium]
MKSFYILFFAFFVTSSVSYAVANSAPYTGVNPATSTITDTAPPVPKISALPASAPVIAPEPETVPSPTMAKTKRKRRYYRQHTVKTQQVTYFANSSFDFNFNGDVAGLPAALQQYDGTTKILPNLGTVKAYPLNLELQHTNIKDIQAFVATKTQNRATLVYDQLNNTLRIIYDSKINVSTDALKQSQIWQDGGTPGPVLSKDGLVLFPYGQYEPKITCQPLQLCDIQLEAGEVVKGLMIGDSLRWNEGDGTVPIIYSGNDGKPSPHVVLKPTDPGLETTLLITTDKRTYYMKLYSSNSVNVSRVGFYYPDEQIQQMEGQRQKNESSDNLLLSDDNLVNPRDMHFNYEVSGDTSAPFNPTQVFDDGHHVYIQMATSISSKDLPAFYVLAPDGDTLQLVNFRYKAPFYIVDKIFDKGVLVLGLDDNEQRITISKAVQKGFWARLFGG